MLDIDDKKSTQGYVFLYTGDTVNWKSFKQSIITDFTVEVEYIVAFEATKVAFWFKKFITEMDVMSSDVIPLYYNNNGVIALAKESRSHQKSKYIERWFYLIREYLKKKYVEVQRVDSTDNVVDPLIKPLSQ